MSSIHLLTVSEQIQFLLNKTISCSECLFWTGPKDNKGYGSIWYRGKKIGVHRLIYQLVYGDFDKSFVVMHTCDIPCCIQPEHLRIGTQKDNLHDARIKGHIHYGEGHYTSRITDDIAKFIYDTCTTPNAPRGIQRQMMRQFKLARNTVNAIVKKRTWKHIHQG